MTTMIEQTMPAVAAPLASQPQSVNPNKALWEKGDFTRIARTMRESGEALVLSLGISPGERVLLGLSGVMVDRVLGRLG